jgi:hypothetical protein
MKRTLPELVVDIHAIAGPRVLIPVFGPVIPPGSRPQDGNHLHGADEGAGAPGGLDAAASISAEAR